MEDEQRDEIIDVGLKLCVQQGYSNTTLTQIAEAADIDVEVLRAQFAMTVDIILEVNDAIFSRVIDTLPDITEDDNVLEALLVANLKVLDDIVDGVGVVTRERIAALSHILNASPELQSLMSARRKQNLGPVLAGKLGVEEDARSVRRTVTMWSAVVVAAHNPHPGLRLRVDPSRDGRVPELMSQCLIDSYRRITGHVPAIGK